MRTLLIGSVAGAEEPLVERLDAAGHDVVRCHHPDGPDFPCSALTEDGCPLEGHCPVDVAITVHREGSPVTARESGATCAVRAGIPLVVVSADDHHPFVAVADVSTGAEGVPRALDRAVAVAAEKRAAPLAAEARRLLEVEGIDAGEVRVDVTRDGDDARIVVWTERPVPDHVANAIATRVHAVDRAGTWPTTRVAVAVGALG